MKEVDGTKDRLVNLIKNEEIRVRRRERRPNGEEEVKRKFERLKDRKKHQASVEGGSGKRALRSTSREEERESRTHCRNHDFPLTVSIQICVALSALLILP